MSEIKKNCSNCKYGLFSNCDTLKNDKEYQELEFIDKFDFKSDYVCDDYKSIFIEYPIQVSKINQDSTITSYKDDQIGKFAKIAPCGDEYEGKTFLGLYLGELPIGHSISHNSKTEELSVSFRTNPAIFVFDLNKIIYGIESWWSIIESEKDLKEIANADINNTWYVKVLNSLK